MGVSHLDSQETKPSPILITESETSGTRRKQKQRMVVAAQEKAQVKSVYS